MSKEAEAVGVVGGPGTDQQEPRAIVLAEDKTKLATPTAHDDLHGLMELALEKGGEKGVEALERLVDLRIKLEDRNATKAYYASLAKFQSECPPAPKKKTASINKDGRKLYDYTYAELDVIAEHIRAPLHRNGLSYTWDSVIDGGNITVICTLRHIDGHAITATCKLPINNPSGMSDQQKVAAATTVGKRQSLLQVTGVTTADPDTDGADTDPTPISAEEAEGLRADIEEIGLPLQKFLNIMSVKAIADIPKVSLPVALNIVTQQREAKKRKAAAAGASS